MIRFLYFSLYLIAFSVAALFSSKIRKMWSQRVQRDAFSKGSPLRDSAPIWIHASSGEFEYAKPVLKLLKARGETTLVTYFSPSYSKQVLGHADVDYAEPLPFDIEGPVRDFFERQKPKELWIARTDLWPEVIRQARRRKIKIILFSASRSPVTGFKRYLSYFNLRLWNQLDRIYCVSGEDKINLETWGVTKPLEVLGDTRYDQVKARLELNKPLYALENWRMTHSIPVLTAGSTWPEDEKILLKAATRKLKANELRLVLAPHEATTSHLASLEAQLKSLGLSHQRWSDNKAWDSQVMIINQFGILAEAYSYGDIAFVGGSYKAKVHSVMEPLAAGCPTLIGPLHTNNREAIEFQKLPLKAQPSTQGSIDAPELSMVTSSSSADELEKALDQLISHPELANFKTQIKNEVLRRTGASQKLIERELS